MMMIIGIDVGAKGGATVICATTGKIVDWCVFNNGGFSLLNLSLYIPNSKIVIEDVGVFATDGKKAAFSFGKQLGALEGIICALNGKIYRRVRPQVWQQFYQYYRTGVGKQRSFNTVKKLFPGAHKEFFKYDGLAESLLMAYWGFKIK